MTFPPFFVPSIVFEGTYPGKHRHSDGFVGAVNPSLVLLGWLCSGERINSIASIPNAKKRTNPRNIVHSFVVSCFILFVGRRNEQVSNEEILGWWKGCW